MIELYSDDISLSALPSSFYFSRSLKAAYLVPKHIIVNLEHCVDGAVGSN